MIRSSRSWIEISKSSLSRNVKMFRKITDHKMKLMAVVKSNAYGHGVKEISNLLNKDKNINWFGVDSIDEALVLRSNKITKPILILGYTPINKLKDAVKNVFSIAIYNIETLKFLVKTNGRVNIHLKIDTGMGRQGIKSTELDNILKILKKSKNINLQGVFTHFASADEEDTTFTKTQIIEFEKSIEKIKENGFDPELIHASATSGTIAFPSAHFNLVRIGIGTYGLYPSPYISKSKKITLKPILEWKCYVAKIKLIKKGETVGYGRMWKSDSDRKVALVPVGYFDGYDRKLSNIGRVIIKGKYCPIVGRVSMNMMSVDVTNIKDINLEDEVILIGKSGNFEVTVDEVAHKIGTINYEVVTRINPNLSRFII